MLGYIKYDGGPAGPLVGERKILGGRFITLSLGQSAHPGNPLARIRAERGAEKLAAMGVSRAVFPVDFPYTARFIRRGIYPVDPLPLRRALAAPLVRRRLGEMGLAPTRAVVAVSADRLTQAAVDTVRALALSFRYVFLHVPGGGEALARDLRREYGVSLLLNPGPDQLDRADALVLFAPRGDLTLENPVLYTLYPGGGIGRGRLELPLPALLEEQVEPNCSREQLTAALYTMGVLDLETILGEMAVDRREKSLYNA